MDIIKSVMSVAAPLLGMFTKLIGGAMSGAGAGSTGGTGAA
jgi:hypothetical protein